VATLAFGGKKRKSVALTKAALARYDCVVVATAHAEFDFAQVARHARSIVDTRNALKGRKSAKILRL